MLADRVGKPFDVPLQEQLKVILNYKRADWTQKIIDKHPEQRKFYYRTIKDSLVRVSRDECPVELEDCTVLRTEHQIPIPIRSSELLFDYVGDPDMTDGYVYSQSDQMYWMLKYSKYTSKRPRWFYTNGYIYVYNEDGLMELGIRGVWADQRQLSTFQCAQSASTTPCYTDNDQWEAPDDIINTIIQDVLKNELRQLFEPPMEEVTVDDQTKG